jgi:hypothetical protein
MSNEKLTAIGESARQLLNDLDAANSSFPATKEFLHARGLTKVSQLNAQGKTELTKYLSDVLKRIAN